MAEHNELGKKGEEIAVRYLLDKGYKIITINWRFGKDEIDIIASFSSFLVIAEVKTRKSDVFEEPEEAVTVQKQKFLVRAADAYVQMKNIEEEVRFDIITVIIKGKIWEINHIEDAFYPTIGF
jgi:putative endonuclease